MQTKPIQILLAEDNEDDVMITQRAFQKAKIVNEMNVVSDGQAALDYLQNIDSEHPMPVLILLDINMPKMSGLEVLKYIKSHEVFKVIPVIMLTSSKHEEDVIDSYMDGAASYIAKPVDHEAFIKTVEQFCIYWSMVVLPPSK
ncbi:MAG: CheY-like chemotaxis protein [Candidatus Omnitrophota bacterium]|jgi:CheY-like chemotaxis protein